MLYNDIFANFDSAYNGFVTAGVGRIIPAFLPVVTTCMGIYIVLYSWSGIRGKVQDMGNDMVARAVKLVLIVSIGFSVAGYGQYVIDPVTSLPTDLTALVVGKSPDQVAGPAILDGQWDKISDLGDQALQNASLMSKDGFIHLIQAIIIYVAGFIMTTYAAYLMLLSKGMLGLLLTIGPICIGCIMFDATKRFFDAWVGLLVNYILVSVFATGAVSFCFVAFGKYTQVLTVDAGYSGAFGLLVIAVISFLIIAQTPQMASSMAGGSPMGNGFGNWVVSAATGGASRILTQGSRWATQRASQAPNNARNRARQSAANQVGRSATSRFRSNSIKGLS